MRCLKAVLPVLILALSLAMIFLALLGSNPPVPAFPAPEQSIACKGDKDCQRRHHRLQRDQTNWAVSKRDRQPGKDL
jgi:hypothetical protein